MMLCKSIISSVTSKSNPSQFSALRVALNLRSSFFARSSTTKTSETTNGSTKTAAILLVGDEILSGKIHDTNGHFLARFLYKQGVDLKRMVVVPDTIEDISRHVVDLSNKFDYVFTSGGIGPTHDDMTYDAIAYAFNTKLVLDEETKARMAAKMTSPLNDARLRMARFPTPYNKLWTPGLWVPIVVTRNVYILPGIPRLFEQMIEANAAHFVGTPKLLINVYTLKLEGDLAHDLEHAQASNEGISIGSYPQSTDKKRFYVKVTVEGRRHELVRKVADSLLQKLDGSYELDPLLS
eukprot:TRINITY_DN2006_c0_g1_i3.p1 TRINITY_DN2006_c0_g1~~TRINITY_DN2006_c0_g1_i3.p1  ORF type:complete len:294 (+),score=71.14 TRINITY_DN2006_c0_g1_i3:119-1000(+)